MESGLPVVATDVGGVSEAVVHEHTGLLVPPGSPEDLAAALARLLTDPKRAAELGATGHELVREKFTLDQMLDGTEDVYRSLIGLP